MSRQRAAIDGQPQRPTVLNDEIAEALCERIANGQSLRSIEKDETMPTMTTVMRWMRDNGAFRQQYADARTRAMEIMAEEILEIADDGANDTYKDEEGNTFTDHDVITRSKLRVEARKWLMSKLAPKKYGDKLDVTSDGKPLPSVIINAPNGGPKP